MNVIFLDCFCSKASSLPRCPPQCPSRRVCPRCPRWSPAGCPPLPGQSGRVWRSGRSHTQRNAASWNVAHSAARQTETSHWTLGLRSFCAPEKERVTIWGVGGDKQQHYVTARIPCNDNIITLKKGLTRDCFLLQPTYPRLTLNEGCSLPHFQCFVLIVKQGH